MTLAVGHAKNFTCGEPHWFVCHVEKGVEVASNAGQLTIPLCGHREVGRELRVLNRASFHVQGVDQNAVGHTLRF